MAARQNTTRTRCGSTTKTQSFRSAEESCAAAAGGLKAPSPARTLAGRRSGVAMEGARPRAQRSAGVEEPLRSVAPAPLARYRSPARRRRNRKRGQARNRPWPFHHRAYQRMYRDHPSSQWRRACPQCKAPLRRLPRPHCPLRTAAPARDTGGEQSFARAVAWEDKEPQHDERYALPACDTSTRPRHCTASAGGAMTCG